MNDKRMKYFFFYSGIFSQWYMRDFKVDGIVYNCAEQYMMAEKARLFGDNKTLQAILKAPTPKEQKALGRKVQNFDNNIWNKKARDIVYRGNHAKFTQNPDLLQRLLDTDDKILVEASGYDKIWGIGLWSSDKRCLDESQWRGSNWLGYTLTKLRNDLKS